MNGKQRAFLRSISNSMDCVFQIGKNGISSNVIKQYDDLLEVRELIKTNVLKTFEYTPKEAALMIAEQTNSNVVSVVGRKFVLYRHSKELASEGKGIVLP